MTWENKIMRTVRCRNPQHVGTLASLLTAIADTGGYVGNIQTISEGHQAVVRDIAIYANDDQQLANIIEAIEGNPGTRI